MSEVAAPGQTVCRDGAITESPDENACVFNGGISQRVDPEEAAESRESSGAAWQETLLDNPWAFWLFSALVISLVTAAMTARPS